MSKRLHALISVLFVFIFASVSVAAGPEYKEGELLVRFAPKENKHQRTKSEKEAILSSINGGTIKHSHEHIVPGLTLVKLPQGQTVDKTIAKFKKTTGILYAEPNYKVKIAAAEPNDPMYHELWGLPRISTPAAWDIRHDACDIIVAVLDTGVDYTHPDLAANMWADANGNHGYDFVNDDNDPMDDYYLGHGTHCAGIIGAVGDNNTGVTGVCWHVKIMALKFIGANGLGDTNDAISSINYAVAHGAKVLSNSWGAYFSPSDPNWQALKDTIEAADANEVLFVAAAGNANSNNDLYPYYPASYYCNNIISVAASDEYDRKASFSNYGNLSVDIAAPGNHILSTVPGNNYDYMNGTSMATPYVAGACALVWSKFPFFTTHLQVKADILCAADRLPSLEGRCVSGGRLNLYNLFGDCSTNPPPPSRNCKADAKAIKISGGGGHTLILTHNKFPFSCGWNGYYQLGIGGNTDPCSILLRVHDGDMNTPSGYLENINDVAAGFIHTFALDTNDSVLAWGNNYYGQLGDASFYDSNTPVRVHGVNDVNYLSHIIAISAAKFGSTPPSYSGMHSLAVDANHLCYAWGYNYYGSLGNGEHGSGKFKTVPVKVKSGEMGGGTYLHNIIAVSAGEDQSMALDSNGFIWAWGQNSYDNGVSYLQKGRLGIGSTSDSNDVPWKVHGPNNVGHLQNIVAISAGWDHCMALEKYDPCDPNYKGRVFTWGWGGSTSSSGDFYSNGGRLGDGSTATNRSTPVIVKAGRQDPNNPNSYLKGIVAIAAGEGHSMALSADGHVFCWGSNYYGQLGNGTNDPCTTPVKVKGWHGIGYLENIVAIATGGWHSLAIDKDGKVWSWGWCKYGQAGLGIRGNGVGSEPTPYVDTPQPIPVAYNLTQQNFDFSIKKAVNDANSGDTIEASQGTYHENVYSENKSINIRSVAPFDPNIVADTIIGCISEGSTGWIIKFESNPSSTLAGLTITNAAGADGIDCNSSFLQIYNCNIKDNPVRGIYCNNSHLNMWFSNITNNGIHYWWGGVWEGIYCDKSLPKLFWCKIEGNQMYGLGCVESSLYIYNSIIRDNCYGGIYLMNQHRKVSALIANNWICDNNAAASNLWPNPDAGIYLDLYDVNNTPSMAYLFNNTIVNNGAYGVTLSYHPHDTNDAYIDNCIIWNNNGSSCSQLYPNNYPTFHSYVGSSSPYCFADPLFVDPCSGNYHLRYNSPCIDEGDPCGGYYWDIDGERRVMDGDNDGNSVIDIGADEFSICGLADFNHDGFVNFLDYAVLAVAWLTQRDEPNYNEICDLFNDNAINYKDLKVFCDCWLWQAPWLRPAGEEGWPAALAESRAGDLADGLTISSVPAAPPQQPTVKNTHPVTPADIEAAIDLLDEFWYSGRLTNKMTEQQYLNLRQKILDFMQRQQQQQ